MKILVTGGRDFKDEKYIYSVLDEYKGKITLLITGDATGVDAIAVKWAIKNNIKNVVYFADWISFGKSAGPIRNFQMLNLNPDIEVILAFPGGKGTKNMIKQGKQHNIHIIIKEGQK